MKLSEKQFEDFFERLRTTSLNEYWIVRGPEEMEKWVELQKKATTKTVTVAAVIGTTLGYMLGFVIIILFFK